MSQLDEMSGGDAPAAQRKSGRSSDTRDSEHYAENIEYKGHIYTRHNYFVDQTRKVDFVLVSSVLKTAAEMDKLVTYIVNLLNQGVEYEISPGKEFKELVFIKLHCPTAVLQHNANIYNVVFDCLNPRGLPPAENKWYNFRIFRNVTTYPDPRHHDYQRAVSSLSHAKQKGLTSWERSFIMEKILMKTQFGARSMEKGVKKLKAAHVIVDAFPTHDGPWEYRATGALTDRQLLNKYWASLTCIFKYQPIQLIYKYYGPEVAFYFAFMGYYTKMLMLPAAIGVFCFVFNSIYVNTVDTERITEVCSSDIILCPECYEATQCDFSSVRDLCYAAKYNVLFDDIGGIGFAIFISIWSTIFLELWLRKEFVAKYYWNLLNYQIDVTPRLEFKQKAKHTRVSTVNGERVNYTPFHVKFFRHMFTFICLACLIAIILLGVISVIYTRLFLHRAMRHPYKYVFTLSLNAFQSWVYIELLNPQFLKISQFLTNTENPCTTLDYYNSCTYKFYILSFCNHYIPVLYMSLLRGIFFTYPSDMRNYEWYGWRYDVCTAVGCSLSLTLFLTYFLGTKMVVTRTYHLVKVLIIKCVRKKRPRRRRVLPAWERDYMLKTCDDLFLMREFTDLVIQYGYVIFFIAGQPLAPLIVVIINMVQVRLDAQRILRSYRRPVAKVLPGIGSWNSILRLVTFVGAIANALVVAINSELIEMEVYRREHGDLDGFLNSSLSVFAVADYPSQFDAIRRKRPEMKYCAYRARRNPPDHDEKYDYSEEQWKIIFVKLCFVLIFQHMSWILGATCSQITSHVPDEVLEELNDEALLVREHRFETIGHSFYGPRATMPTRQFQIE